MFTTLGHDFAPPVATSPDLLHKATMNAVAAIGCGPHQCRRPPFMQQPKHYSSLAVGAALIVACSLLVDLAIAR